MPPRPPFPDVPDDPAIDDIVERYLREMARYELAAQAVADRLRRELRAEARMRHLLSFRAKHPEDLREKLKRKVLEEDEEAASGRPRRYLTSQLYRNLNDVVTDLAGCRVVVYEADDEARVAALIDRTFAFPDRGERDDTKPAPLRQRGGYRATHRLVLASTEELSLSGAICEIQISTLSAHLFNELEHDITYKERLRKASPEERECLADVRRVTKLADRQVSHLMNAQRRGTAATDIIASPEALRFSLESMAERDLSGDFARLYQMLNAIIRPLSRHALQAMGQLRDTLEHGSAEALELDIGAGDDVIHIVLGLTQFREEFLAQASSFRGPRTPLRRALDALAKRHSVDNQTRVAQAVDRLTDE